jgi:hypothetical protein
MLPSRIWQISSSLCQFVDWFFILNSESLLRIKDFKKTSWRTGTEPLVISFVMGYVVSVVREFLMFDELWSEINDSQGEIFDVIDFKEEWEQEEKFDVEKHINGNTEF